MTIEALHYGLPVLVHHHDVAKYVLGEIGSYSDFTKTGNLTQLISQTFTNDLSENNRRKEYAMERFSWTALSGEYLKLLNRSYTTE